MILGKISHRSRIGSRSLFLLESLEPRQLLSAALGAKITATLSASGSTGTLAGDANDDGIVDLADYDVWSSTISTAGPADFNRDGITDFLDFDIWFANVGASESRAPSAPVAPIAPPTVAYDWHTQIINGILNVWVPNPTDFGDTWTVTDSTELFGSDGVPNLTSIHQGGIADCYFLSAIGSLASTHPSQIMQEVQNDPAGGWAVTYQYNFMGKVSPVVFHTSNQLSSTWQTQINGEVWQLVMEKTYAAFRTFNGTTGANTMASLSWGFGNIVLTQLGEPSSSLYVNGQSVVSVYNTLANAIASKHPVLLPTSALAPTMVASHVYVITSVYTDTAGVRWATTYNPWGFYDARPITELIQNSSGALNIGTI